MIFFEGMMTLNDSETHQIKKKYNEWHSRINKNISCDIFYHWLMKIINKNAQTHTHTFLDVACGEGGWMQFCEEMRIFKHCCGIDISIIALKRAKVKTRVSDFILADAEHLPFKREGFDIVSCLGSLEHFRDPEKGAKEISIVMKKTGRSYVFLPNAYFLGHVYMVYKTGEPPDEGGQYFSERFATKNQWEQLLDKSGLQILQCLKYNRIGKASRKVSILLRVLYNLFVAPFLPLNLSYAFLFILKKINEPRV